MKWFKKFLEMPEFFTTKKEILLFENWIFYRLEISIDVSIGGNEKKRIRIISSFLFTLFFKTILLFIFINVNIFINKFSNYYLSLL